MAEIQLDENVVDPGAFTRPDDYGAIPPTPRSELDAAVADLQGHKTEWVTLDLGQRIGILDQILDDLHDVGLEWVEAHIAAKGTRDNKFAEAEDWAILAYVYRNIRLLGDSLRQIQRSIPPQIPGKTETLPNGQVRAQVFPVDWYDRLVFMGMTAEVWMPPGTTHDDILDGQAQFYRGAEGDGKVALVLGAGNTANLIPADFLYKLFVEGSVVILCGDGARGHILHVAGKVKLRLVKDELGGRAEVGCE